MKTTKQLPDIKTHTSRPAPGYYIHTNRESKRLTDTTRTEWHYITAADYKRTPYTNPEYDRFPTIRTARLTA